VHFIDNEGNLEGDMNIEEDSDMYEDDGGEDPQDENLGIFCKQIMGVRPTTSTLTREANDVPLRQLTVVEDSMPFPELFDRSERTFAATFARYGDLSYFTPVQRIGTYMEFQSRLKRKHLMDLISYLKTASNAAKQGGEEETLEVANLNFLNDSLFLGVMPFESRLVQPKKGKKGKTPAIKNSTENGTV